MAKLEATERASAKLVFLGDYVDRGDHSADVLRRLHLMQSTIGADHMICLRGNHDQMLIDFLDRPKSSGARWFRHGGLQTLGSYGIPGVGLTASDDDWNACRDKLRAAMGEELESWLRALPLSWKSGNVFVCHAGADPALPIDMQNGQTLIWGHDDFEKVPRADGLWVVHGHTITEQARPIHGRIPVDTGAYATGRLTAALLETGKVQFFST